MNPGQKDIYYILGDDERSIIYSPHLDYIKKYGFEVILLTDPIDPFMVIRLAKFKDHDLINVSSPDIKLPQIEKESEAEIQPTLDPNEWVSLIQRFKTQLGDKVADVRMTDRLSESPARLVDPEGVLNQEMQRVYRLLQEDFKTPKKVLELNTTHPILIQLNSVPQDTELSQMVIDQIYEDALLIEGLLQNPARMIERIQKIMAAAIK
jgi:molecular chaperone HtpG